jgi:predicted PurR-regulated permease PerM
LTLSVFATFYLYRDGIVVAARFRAGMERIAGQRAHTLIDLAARTVKGVVYGILGTALAQGAAATIGFSIAGVPGPVFLGLLTSVVSIVPAGPPLLWIPAAIWLLQEGSPAWAAFMALWGFFAISGIDNVVRPYLISQGAALPFLLVLLGVIGGLLAFGFIGVFLGPTLLAVGFALVREWTFHEAPARDEDAAGTPH